MQQATTAFLKTNPFRDSIFLASWILFAISGCDQLGIPKPAEPAAAQPEPAPIAPEPPAAPPASFSNMANALSPEQQVAEFLKKTGPAITDAEIQKVVALSPANQAIQALDLRAAQYTPVGLTALQQLPNLKSLSLVGCSLQGNDWAPLAKLTQLESLNLQNSLLDDISVEAVGALVNLKALDISSSRVTDQGFRHLVRLTKLEEIHCNNMSITGAGFEAFTAKYANSPLRIAGVSQTQFGTYGFAHLQGRENLAELYAGNAGVSDVSVQDLRGMKNLRKLKLGKNTVSDQGLKVLSGLSDLEELDISENALVSDFTLGKIKNFQNLKVLSVQATTCSLQGVQQLAELLPNCEIIFQDRKF